MTTGSAPAKDPSVSARIAELTRASISGWQRGYLADESHSVAALARLRRGAGREAGESPDLWTLIDTGALHSQEEGGPRHLSEPEVMRAENAVHAALTLWAFHQQSRGEPMHRCHSPGQPASLGAAVRRLMPPDDIDEPVRKRLVRAGTAPDLVSLAQRLRDIVALLRRKSIPLDYGLLAGQLYVWQWPDGPSAVRRAWGRSFHTPPRRPRQPTGDSPTTPHTDKDHS